MASSHSFALALVLTLASCRTDGATWQESEPGIWSLQCGRHQPLNLVSAASATPKTEALRALGTEEFPLDETRIETTTRGGRTYLRFPLERDEQIFGLGLQFQTTNQRGRILDLHVDHYGKRDDGRTHAPVPFYVSSRGYGVFVNSAEYLTVYVGTGVRKDADDPAEVTDRNADPHWNPRPYSDSVEILVPADGAEVFVIGGPTPLEVVQRFNLLTGGGVLPPRWGLGFTHRVPRLYSDREVLAEVREFEEHDFPLDFVGLEPGWQSHAYPCSFDWDPARFPEPERFVARMRERGVGVNLWFNPYVAPSSSIHDEILPYTGSHTVWNGRIPDLTLDEPRRILERHFAEKLVGIGVEGFKIDEIDGYDVWLWPDTASFPSGHSAEQMRQVYGLLVQELIAGVYRDQNTRTYGLARASNGGGSGLPFVIYNDNYSHQNFINALTNSSFSGVLWTPEVRSSETEEEWLRRMQSVCFSPLAMINAWSSGTKPWTFAGVEDAVREVAYLRMQLLPYFYTTFAQYAFEGTPPVRSLNLVYSGEGDAEWRRAIRKGVKDQYLFGDSLLVAPMFAGESKRSVVFPEGKWFDFYSGAYAGEAEVKEVVVPLERIPLYVRDGGIIPMIAPRRQARTTEATPLIVRHYGGSEGVFELYDDDGETFDYERGEYQWRRLAVERVAGELQGDAEPASAEFPASYTDVSWRFMTED